jgi:class 3 adenylate cyclase/tetratricopeptide (TPR) repeat protein
VTGPENAPPLSYTPKFLAEKILASRSALEGEWKQVTVLFCDIVESSRLAAQMGPEAMHRIMDGALRTMADAIHQFEGTVNQFLGDGLMALFGAPVALEDHALRGVLAALALREAIGSYRERLRRESGVDVRVRLGLNTGPVVVGRIGDDLRMDYTAVGGTTHLAARVQALAEPGAILITEVTYRLVEEAVRTEGLGPVTVKGWDEPVRLYRVVGAREGRGRLEARAERGLAPLVGRRRERDLLRWCFDQAAAGRGQGVGIVGEPGVGKSRLLYEFRRSLEGEEIPWLEGHCVSYGRPMPWSPILQILRAALGLREGEDPLQAEGQVRHRVLAVAGGMEDAVPYLLDLLGWGEGKDASLKVEPQLKRRRTFGAVAAYLLAAGGPRPHVLVVEDLQWLDNTSEEFLAFLADSLAGRRLLLLTTHRPGYTVPWAGRGYYTQVALSPLEEHEVENLLDALLGPDAALAALRRLLAGRAAGNPFFLEEMVRMLADADVLAGVPGAYGLGKSAPTLQMPATVQAVLAARIDRLPSDVKRLLQTAAVIGRDVPLLLLQAVADQPEEAMRPALAQLQAGGFLRETALFPEAQYAFAHPLTHEVAYEGLLQDARQSLHARIVPAVEKLYPHRLGEWADRLAHHVVRGEVWGRALTYLRPVGAESWPIMERSLWWRGEHRQAVELGESELAMAAPFKNFPLQVTGWVRLGQAYHALGDYPRAIASLRRAVEALEGDLRGERFEMPAPAIVLAHIWLAWCLAERGEYAEGSAHGEAAVRIAREMGDPGSLALAWLGVATCSLRAGQFAEAIPVLREALDLAERGTPPEWFPLWASPLGLAYAIAGEIGKGLPLLEQAVERAGAANFLALQPLRSAWLARGYLEAGRPEEAGLAARRAVELSQRTKERGHEAHALRMLGEVLGHPHFQNWAEAIENYRQAMALADELGMRPLKAECRLALANLYRRRGDAEGARSELAAACELFRAMGMTFWSRRAEAELEALGRGDAA